MEKLNNGFIVNRFIWIKMAFYNINMTVVENTNNSRVAMGTEDFF